VIHYDIPSKHTSKAACHEIRRPKANVRTTAAALVTCPDCRATDHWKHREAKHGLGRDGDAPMPEYDPQKRMVRSGSRYKAYLNRSSTTKQPQ